MVVFDIVWLLLLRDDFYFKEGSHNPLALSSWMWKYNHYVVYASITMLVIKVAMY